MSRKLIEYKSNDYGVFLIEQIGKKWIINWDPEEACEYHGINEYQGNFDFLLTRCCENNPKNLTSNDFKDLPVDGKFSSELEAKQYIESKFGKIK